MDHCGPTGGRLNSMKISMAEVPESGGCEKIAAEAKVDVSDLIQFGFGLKSAKEAFKIAVSFKEEELFKALDNLKFKQTV